MQKILLTGSGGFVGRNLKPFLENKGFKVVAPRSSQYDFSDLKIVQQLNAEYNPDIFILAGFYGINTPVPPQDIFEKNLQILNKFIAVSNSKPVFTFGSGAEFDKSLPIVLAKDEAWKNTPPADLYGRAKYLISQEIKKYPGNSRSRDFLFTHHARAESFRFRRSRRKSSQAPLCMPPRRS